MSKGRWSFSVPQWHTVWHKMVKRKYGYNAPSLEDNQLFAEKARAVWKRYQRMKRKQRNLTPACSGLAQGRAAIA